MSTPIPQLAIDFIKAYEKLSLVPYDDNGDLPGGEWTIGYGALTLLDGSRVTPVTRPITEDVAERLFARDIARKASVVDDPSVVRRPMTPPQRAAWLSFAFNLGEGALMGSTALRLFNAGDVLAAANALAPWRNQRQKGVLRPMTGLRRRRWAEAVMLLGGDGLRARLEAEKLIDSPDDWPDPQMGAARWPLPAAQKPQEAPVAPAGAQATPDAPSPSQRAPDAPRRGRGAGASNPDALALLGTLAGQQP